MKHQETTRECLSMRFVSRRRKGSGFSLVEILVVVAITFGLAALFLVSFKTLRDRGVLESATEQVIGSVEEARALTLSGKGGSAQGIHITSTTVTIFPGAVYVSGNAANTVIVPGPFIILTSVPGTDMVFQKGTGKTDQQYILTIALSTDTTQNHTVTIYATGAIKTQ